MNTNKRQEINYLYFSFFLITIIFFSLSYVFNQENSWSGEQFFFMLHTIGQSLLEVCFFTLIAYSLKQCTSIWVFYSFIGFSFIALLAHYVDFTLLRLMDTSFSYLFQFFFGSGVKHLYTGFLALNMNMTIVGYIVGSIFLLPLIGVGFYRLTHLWTQKKPWSVSLKELSKALLIVGSCLALLDLFAYPWLDKKAYNKYEKALPFGRTFLSPASTYIKLKDPLPSPRSEELTTKRLEQLTPSTAPLPNIYFFIIETLRSDFINESVAPTLSQFIQENISFRHTYANANYSNLSWFALLHATFPYQWTTIRDHYREGSAALRLLKKLGYQVRVYSSADLSYFNMQTTLFGQKHQLIDHLEQYSNERHLEPCDRDALAIKAFARDIEQHPHGTLYLFFLDSTHSEYSFPKDFPLKFQPITDEISYLTISKSHQDLELLKNRYRNSIFYVDSLLEQFFFLLKKQQLYKESIIAITGDHAEEFFEEGSLFHGTHLNRYQIAVPIACKIQNNAWMSHIDPQKQHLSHIDIFPSIIHYITRSLDFADLFDGESMFASKTSPYHLSFLQNGANPPLEFSLEWEGKTIRARISNPNILEMLESSNLEESSINYHVLKAFERPAIKDL